MMDKKCQKVNYRCPCCKKLLFRSGVRIVPVEIKCARCGKVVTVGMCQ